jgi:hypothetical protein
MSSSPFRDGPPRRTPGSRLPDPWKPGSGDALREGYDRSVRRYGWLAAVAAVVMSITILGGAWLWRSPLIGGWWTLSAARPLAESDLRALEACDDVDWTALTRILEQDVDVHCGPWWLEAELQAHPGGHRTEWLRRFAADEQHAGRMRYHVGMALLLSGETPTPGLAILAGDPAVDAADRDALIARLAAGSIVSGWLDPSLEGAVAILHFEAGDPTDAGWIAEELRLRAVGARSGEDAADGALVTAVLDGSGFGGGRLDRLQARRARGLPLIDVPPELHGLIADRGGDCADGPTSPCLRFAADLLDATRLADLAEGEGSRVEPPPAPATLADPLWDVLFDADAATISAARDRVRHAASFVAATPGGRESALLGLVANPRHRYTVDRARSGPIGDPLEALTHRRATPWATALAALIIGAEAGIPVSVSSVGAGVVLDVDGHRMGVGPCGIPLVPPAVPGEAWPPRAVAAQAAVEAAGGAVRQHAPARAARLAVLAERLDPIGAAGTIDTVRQIAPLDVDPGGLALGGLVAGADRPVGDAAKADRVARAATLSHAIAAWSRPPEPACPAPLGP